eukprot:TRINITY_DN50259_c0_g1_i1.p1 TRINITY_DN50259_c0_g1~~TRINITY_DN50259_c0_g1_i1.p1  ORF type:complete len:370 (+),score=73.28 TRINITY_DN50259_c0_g1_i1:46-1110(+)
MASQDQRLRATLLPLVLLVALASVLFKGLVFVSTPHSLAQGVGSAAQVARQPVSKRGVALKVTEEETAAFMADVDEEYVDSGGSLVALATLKKMQEFDGIVVKVVERGVIVDIGAEIEGFIPIGKMVPGRIDDIQDAPKEMLTAGRSIKVWVSEVDTTGERKKLILSAVQNKALSFFPRASLDSFRDVDDETWFDGTVARKEDYGAFVALKPLNDEEGWASGLMPTSAMKDPNVAIGSTVKVRVVKIDDRDRMELSSKAKPADISVFKDVPTDKFMTGIVRRLQNFGAFVEVPVPDRDGETADGLVPLAEIEPGTRVEDPAEYLEVDMEVQVRVLAVTEKGLSLSMLPVPVTAD